ncbi:DEAD/DEAH box helicase [soil metagenome]
MSFDNFNLDSSILSCVQTCGYTSPTPIQKQSIPVILEGHDVMGLAQTGTGKTAAFVLPILQHLLKGPRGRARVLIIAPTRELVQQIHDTIGKLAAKTGLRSVTLYGGVNINAQIQKMRRGIEIIVACPGRLLDHLRQRTTHLGNIEILVLDEADHMFDMGFLPSIQQILQQLPKQRQSLLFSATMPEAIRDLAHDVLHKPVTIQIDHTLPTKTVKQTLFPVIEERKTALLFAILQTIEISSVLIFTRTKHRAKNLALKLEQSGYSATSLQGNLSQNKRQSALDSFRSGELQILVATDIASRGIDVAKISHVINYDMPNTVEAYTHRIGRTGRAMHIGDAYTLVTREDMSRVRNVERMLGTRLPQQTLENFDYKPAGAASDSHNRTSTARPHHQHRKPTVTTAKRTYVRPSDTGSANRYGHAPLRQRKQPIDQQKTD